MLSCSHLLPTFKIKILSVREKEWKGIKVASIKEDEDGTNNFNESKQKSQLDFDADGYWIYIDGLDSMQ